MLDPQLERVLRKLAEGDFVVEHDEDAEEKLPGIERASRSNLVHRFDGGVVGPDSRYSLTTTGREAIGLPPETGSLDRLIARAVAWFKARRSAS